MTTTPPAVLVLGARSLIGPYLLQRLAASGVVCLCASRQALGQTYGAERIAVDLDGDVAAALDRRPISAVISLCPIWKLSEAALDAFAAAGATRLIAFSSTSRITKADSPDPEERRVAADLAAGEDRVQAAGPRVGLAWTLFRPTLIYAEGRDGNVSRLAGLIRRFGVLPLAGDGGGLRQPVHADDLAAAAVAALAVPATQGKIYALTGSETLTYAEMAQRVFEGLGRKPILLRLPPKVWSFGFALARPFLPGAKAQMGARMAEDLTFDSTAAAQDFGYAPRPFRPQFAPKPLPALGVDLD